LSGAQTAAQQTVSGSSANVLVSSEGTTIVSYFATDNVGNVEAAKTLTIRLDKTAPALTFGAATPAPNAAGWNNTNVTAPFTASDSLSGLDSVSASSPLLLTAEGSAVSATIAVTDLAGNSATFTSPAVKIDKTAPLINGLRTPLPNGNGWNNTPVTVSFPCSDALSGLAAGSPPAATVLSADGANQSAGGSCRDLAGNTASVTADGINIDRTPPIAIAAASPAANANGWNNSNVTVSFTGSDSQSGIDGCTPPVVVSAEASGQSASGTCRDRAGNVSELAEKTGINIDKTAPALTFGAATPAPNTAGWNNSNVTIPFSVTDALSGVQSSTPASSPLVLAGEGAAVTGTVMVTDRAGNTATFPSAAVKIDKTAPLLIGSRSPAANVNGWNNTDVTVAFTCSDALAGVATLTPGASVVVSLEGPNQSVAAACLDLAGNAAATTVAPINVDKTKPVVTDVTAGAAPINSAVTLRATITEGGSGMASAEYSVDNGAFAAMALLDGQWSAPVAPFAAAGVHTACVRGADQASNAASTVCALFAVYDPDGGFVTGGGWITSPPGAYAPDPSLTGKAHFAFVSKYQKGAGVPTGNTQFQFQTANLDFKSTAYEWLVVAGARAQFKGTGTLNGVAGYGFLLTAIDGAVSGGGGVDKFRIKIQGPGGVVYDNQMGADDNGDAATALGGGSIVVQRADN
jgi:hypothetical protein